MNRINYKKLEEIKEFGGRFKNRELKCELCGFTCRLKMTLRNHNCPEKERAVYKNNSLQRKFKE